MNLTQSLVPATACPPKVRRWRGRRCVPRHERQDARGPRRRDRQGDRRARHPLLEWRRHVAHRHLRSQPGRDVQGDFEPIKTSVNGIVISEIFPLLAKQMKHVALIRSIAGQNGDHGRPPINCKPATLRAATCSTPHRLGRRQRTGLARRSAAYVTVNGLARRLATSVRSAKPTLSPARREGPVSRLPSNIGEVRGNKRLDILKKINEKQSGTLPADEISGAQTALATPSS